MRSILSMFILLIYSSAFCQTTLKIPVSYERKGKIVDSAKYYVVEDANAYLLQQVDNNLVFNDNVKDELKILMIHKSDKIEFLINPKKLYYLKISRDRSIKHLFQPEFIINQGFDYVEVVKKTKARYKIIKRR